MVFWLLSILPAFAQEDDPDDDIDIDLDEPEAPGPAAPPRPDDEDLPDDLDEPEDDEDLTLPEAGKTKPEDLLADEDQAVSSDTERVYRRYVAELSELAPDEELAGWEEYLSKYPDSAYKARIETRMEELQDQLYSGSIREEESAVDAMRQEMSFSQPMLLENINPRTRLQAAFEFGLPTYINLSLDYEHQFTRKFSFHAGARRRYSGYNVEAGVRWALAKSVRTGTLVTFIGDLHFNTIPAYPGFRPQLALGKKIGKMDLLLQGGADLAYRPELSTIQPTIVGGAHAMYRLNDALGAFLETSTYMKPVAEQLPAFDGGLFRFNVITFGFKFYPSKKGNQEVNAAANVPYMQEWWQFHYGSVMGQYNWYPKD